MSRRIKMIYVFLKTIRKYKYGCIVEKDWCVTVYPNPISKIIISNIEGVTITNSILLPTTTNE